MFEVALHKKRIPKSMQSNLLSTPLHLNLKKIQGLFKDLLYTQIQGLFKEKWNSRTFKGLPLKFKDFQDCANSDIAVNLIHLLWLWVSVRMMAK